MFDDLLTARPELIIAGEQRAALDWDLLPSTRRSVSAITRLFRRDRQPLSADVIIAAEHEATLRRAA